MKEYTVTVTQDDVDFLRLARSHYKLFAETLERQGVPDRDGQRSLGIFRAQEFHAERFLLRIEGREDR